MDKQRLIGLALLLYVLFAGRVSILPVTKPTMATYVYEQRQHPVPREVAAAISKLNIERKAEGFVASVFDQNTLDGGGQVPDQYAVALEAAKKEGLPCLVIQAGKEVLRVVKAPTTGAQVMDAVK